MPWQRARFPVRPQPARFPPEPEGEATVVTVDDAIVTQAQRGKTASVLPPTKWIRGAVHTADGHLVPESQRSWGGDRESPIATDPKRLTPMPDAPRQLAGTWLYGGHFMPGFGHFIVETLTNLWPEARDLTRLTGVLFHHGYRVKRARVPSRDVPLQPLHEDLFDLAGYGGVRKHEVLRRPLQVERLLVPTRPIVFKGWALPEATRVWQRVGEAAGPAGPERRVFLSRAEFNRVQRAERPGEYFDRSTQEYDDRLDVGMAGLGLTVVEPQTLSIREQIRLVRGADVLVSTSGSALHLSAFARPDVRVIELGDARTRAGPLPAQRVIDTVYGRTTAFVPRADPESTAAEVAALLDPTVHDGRSAAGC